VISTGVDTFSRATFDDLVREAEQAKTPVYVLSLTGLARHGLLDTSSGPLARIDWRACEQQLETLARVSGGRAYRSTSTVDVAAIYDDIMEHLRVRYVITYVPSPPAAAATPRKVEVTLVNPSTGAPLRITDASGRRVTARVLAEASYTPPATTTRTSG
jgi:hypothetical protein